MQREWRSEERKEVGRTRGERERENESKRDEGGRRLVGTRGKNKSSGGGREYAQGKRERQKSDEKEKGKRMQAPNRWRGLRAVASTEDGSAVHPHPLASHH